MIIIIIIACSEQCFRSYLDLPNDIISTLSDRLPLIELLCFRATCKVFRSISFTSSAEMESCTTPFLIVSNSNTLESLIYDTHRSKKNQETYLQGATCLASYQGWLLLYKQESVCFCPFSLAKILLPNFPHNQLNSQQQHH